MPYLVLEVLGMPEAKNIKVIGVPRDKVVTLGRSERSDLMINDQSISNRHSKIFFSSLINKFVLQDYDSKYGTLKIIQQPQLIEPGRKLYVQVGCAVLQIEVEQDQPKKPSMLSKFCGCFSKNRDKTSLTEKGYMKRTLNPKDPVKNEVQQCKERGLFSEFNVKQQGMLGDTNGCRYDFMNYPDAIPEECFIFFSNKVEGTQMTQKEVLLNMHFLNKHF